MKELAKCLHFHFLLLSSSSPNFLFFSFSFLSPGELTDNVPRFVSVPPPKLCEKLRAQVRTLEGDVESLGKRLVYLETTRKNSREHIDKMLKQAPVKGSGAN